MEKLRLEVDRLKVESFAPDAKTGRKGTVRAHDDSDCSVGYTCGISWRSEESYELELPTRYGCCI